MLRSALVPICCFNTIASGAPAKGAAAVTPAPSRSARPGGSQRAGAGPAQPWVYSAPTVRVRDIARVQSVRSNQLVGYGLVVGLDGTGDSAQSPFTLQSVVAMLQRKNGATLEEIMSQMGWQKHTVRGFMAGAMKKAGYTVESFKSEKGERTYRINQ